MRRITSFTLTLAIGSLLAGSLLAEDPTIENTTIKTIMNGAHSSPPKGTGLLKKVATGQASEAEPKRLLSLYRVMEQLKPPKDDDADWKERTRLLVSAVEETIAGKKEGPQLLQKAANCKACHDAHKAQ